MRWKIYEENGKLWVRRWVKGKFERLPISRYRRIRADRAKLSEFVTRLNAPIDARVAVQYRHAFINDALLADYFDYLCSQIPNQANAKTEFYYLKTYALNFFIVRLELLDVQAWHDVHETKWAHYLQSKELPESVKTKRDIVNALNRFVKWLHKLRDNEVPLLEFRPISKAKFKQIDSIREMGNKKRRPTFVPAQDWEIIRANLPPDLAPYALISYHYGLRRNECVALRPSDVKKGHLTVERQSLKIGQYGPTKDREPRKVPHWNMAAKDCYLLIESMRPIHPCTVSDRWRELMSSLGLSYMFNDLRHTFATLMMRKHLPRDVQLAMGHEDISTTMGYLHDDSDTDDEMYIPA